MIYLKKSLLYCLMFDMLRYSCRISFVLLICVSCKKKTNQNFPQINIIKSSEYVFDGQILPIGKPYQIAISAVAGGAPITNIKVTLTTQNGCEIALDSGIYKESIKYIKSNSYGATAYEMWTFYVRDKNGKSATTNIVLKKDPNSNFGLINYFHSVTLGAQSSPYGSFMNAMDARIFHNDSAEYFQNLVNFIAYWGDLAVPSYQFTFSSPAENEATTYYPLVNNFVVPRNEVRYKNDSTSITAQDFDDAYNDSLIISNYTSATVGKRKFKMLRPGYVIPFAVSVGQYSGKRGLIKILSVTNGRDGNVVFDLKMQK